MSPYSTARWTRSLSAPPCPGAWSYRTLGKFPGNNTATTLTNTPHRQEERHITQHQRQQQQQQQQQQQTSSIHHVLHQRHCEQQELEQPPHQHAKSVLRMPQAALGASTSTLQTLTSTSASTSLSNSNITYTSDAAQRRAVNVNVASGPPQLTRAQDILPRLDHAALMRSGSTSTTPDDQHLHIRLPPPTNSSASSQLRPFPSIDQTAGSTFNTPDSSTNTHHYHYNHHCTGYNNINNPADPRNPPYHQPCCLRLHDTTEQHSPTAIRHHSYINPQSQPQPVHPEFRPQPPPSRVHDLSLQTNASVTARISNDTGTRKRTRTSTEGSQRPNFVHSHSYPARYPPYTHSHHVHSSATIPENIRNHPPCYSCPNPHDSPHNPPRDHHYASHTHTHAWELSRTYIPPSDLRSLQIHGELGTPQRPCVADGNSPSARGCSVRPGRLSLSGSSVTSPISPKSTTSMTRSMRTRQQELDGSDAQSRSPRGSIRGELFTSSLSPSTSQYPTSQSPQGDSDSNIDDLGDQIRHQGHGDATPAPKQSRKSYTREFKLEALDLLKRPRTNDKGELVSASDTWVSKQFGVTRKVLRGWKVQEEKLRASRRGSKRVRLGKNRMRRGKVVETEGTHGELGARMSKEADEDDEEEQEENEDLPMGRSCRHSSSKTRETGTRRAGNGSEEEIDEDTDLEEDEVDEEEELDEEDEDEGGHPETNRMLRVP